MRYAWLRLFLAYYAGLLVKLLYAFIGLMPGVLSISGFVIWVYHRKPEPVRVKANIVKV